MVRHLDANHHAPSSYYCCKMAQKRACVQRHVRNANGCIACDGLFITSDTRCCLVCARFDDEHRRRPAPAGAVGRRRDGRGGSKPRSNGHKWVRVHVHVRWCHDGPWRKRRAADSTPGTGSGRPMYQSTCINTALGDAVFCLLRKTFQLDDSTDCSPWTHTTFFLQSAATLFLSPTPVPTP